MRMQKNHISDKNMIIFPSIYKAFKSLVVFINILAVDMALQNTIGPNNLELSLDILYMSARRVHCCLRNRGYLELQ